ncbi:glycosyltransferase family 2 protein [Microscilla marina]|uniref:Glycosyl transferase, group 2 family protein n=1 Tax=Microscilla marina ATCC 23134 TaxID=313606 RepID=A1ZPH8_MICM2|nr:glycosyltransferase family 2 protein [Microscilla marina]EAY27717.1 glycosyl transferase, group 2 family protein [Microscilla marina ATCC 23134]
MTPKVAVVILNYNGRAFLEKFLPSVIQYSDHHSIVVADNASTDDSIDFMKNTYPEVRLIEMERNTGFSQGYNIALKEIEAEYYVLLNSDVEVTPHWLQSMVEFMDAHPQVAACQPKIKAFHRKSDFEYAGAAGGFIDKLGYPFCRGRIFDEIEADKGQYNDVYEIFWATGACMFVRASLYWQQGGLDNDFFAHMEEIDLCWRFKNAGYQVYYVGTSEVYHVGGGTLPKSNPRKTFLNFRNNLALLYKNLPKGKVWTTLCWRFWLDGVAWLHFMLKGQVKDALAISKAYWKFYTNVRFWQKKRKSNPNYSIHPQMLRQSLVFAYFFKKKRRFHDLIS